MTPDQETILARFTEFLIGLSGDLNAHAAESLVIADARLAESQRALAAVQADRDALLATLHVAETLPADVGWEVRYYVQVPDPLQPADLPIAWMGVSKALPKDLALQFIAAAKPPIYRVVNAANGVVVELPIAQPLPPPTLPTPHPAG